jgi:DNA-binding transcriptional regulator YiaG
VRRRTKRPTGTGSEEAFQPFDPALVTKLRVAIGKIVDKSIASREVLAELLELSPATIFNWEHGTVPHRKHRRQLLELKRSVETGTLVLPARGRRKADRTRPHGYRAWRNGRDALYANVVAVEILDDVAWLHFGLTSTWRSS